MPKRPYLFWGFRAPRELLRARLGTLERQAIEVVWESREVTVREVHARLDGRVAYTTVMTTLDRLFRKGLLGRTRRSRAFVYSPLVSREEIDGIFASDVVSGMLAGDGSAPLPFLSNLVDEVGRRDRALLEELERLVKDKQRQLARGSAGSKASPGSAKREDR